MMVDSVVSLKNLLPGQFGEVFRLEGRPEDVHRLEEFGLGRGTRIEMFRAGNPCIVRMGSNKFCLRLDRALDVLVRPAG
ncbi:MAG: ferrous iron transport protein A [Pirellulaceae bacterium]|nr:ferrous iron transport protein A [Pirellulaceae bacterium]